MEMKFKLARGEHGCVLLHGCSDTATGGGVDPDLRPSTRDIEQRLTAAAQL